jgi:hypothetical protein
MSAPILTQAATITCPHGGQGSVVPQNVTIKIAGSPVLVVTDPGMIAGCPFNISGSPAPCLTIQWAAPAVLTKAGGVPVLLSTSIGLCIGGSGAVPAIIIPAQTQILGT